MKDDKLMLSVYTAKEGLGKDSEHNTLMELIGDATQAHWTPEPEVFEDNPHIARSSMHLTAMQLTKMTLADVVKRASTQQQGTVYSVIPAVRDGKSVFEVMVATPDGKSAHLTLDATTGKAMKERVAARR
ncbi:MAG: PepSY domain-containing protein [Pyrinomonadaceae bacterium]|nr:PepSY domain-containing protein [Pyrinomonadaceae bacterium]